MHNWIVMIINVSYMLLAYIVFRTFKPKFLDGAHLSLIAAELFLVSIFFQIGLLLFDIPIGFFGMNNPHTIASLKEKWWAAPGLGLSGLTFVLSCRSALVAFRRKRRFQSKDWQLLLLSSLLFGLMIICLLFVTGIKSDTMAAEDQQFILDYWWGFGLFFGFVHLICLSIIKGVLYLRSLNDESS